MVDETPPEGRPGSVDTGKHCSSTWPTGEWDRYVCKGLLGAGGMGRVYKAWDPRLERHVAIKFLVRDDPVLVERLFREARAQARLEHPNVCQVYEVGEVGGHPFIAMQFIDGRTLADVGTSLSREQKIRVMHKVSAAVHAAHRAGLVHRDLKPANIMLEEAEDGSANPFVVDFGLVRELDTERLTATGMAMGTPAYMAPEQAIGDYSQVDRRTDVYGLGATLYSLLTGKPPFSGSGLQVMVRAIHEDPIPLGRALPGISRDLETIVMKCLEKDPNRRYESARALAEDLLRFLDGEAILARPATWTYRLGKKARKNRAALLVAAPALLAAVVFLGMWLHARRDTEKEMLLAQQFGREVEQIDALMRTAYLLPAHDTAQEKQIVLERMVALEEQMRRLGRLSHGPGEHALGRAWIALRDYEQARTHLDVAWNKLVYRPPEVAYDLGLTLARLYQEALVEAERIPDKASRDARRTQLESELKSPALQMLARGNTATAQVPEYPEALIAFLERRYDQALLKARSASARLPSLYEAEILAGDVCRAMADASQEAGRTEEASRLYGEAESAYRSAIRTGASDPLGYVGLCALKRDLMILQAYQTAVSPEPTFEQALEVCDQVLVVDPDSATALENKLAAYSRWAEYRFNQGEDPRDAVEQAVTIATRLTAVDPGGGKAHNPLGIAFWIKGQYEQHHGLDPSDSFRTAIDSCRSALSHQPNSYPTHTVMSLAYHYLGVYERTTGRDPLPSLDQAIASLGKALELNPKYFFGYSNLCNTYHQKALHERNCGKDPGQSIQASVENGRAAVAINPANFIGCHNLGVALLEEGKYRIEHGEDPSGSLGEALLILEKSRSINPASPYPLMTLGRTRLALGQWQLDQGRPAHDDLDAAAADLLHCLEISPDFDLCLNALARVYLSQAESDRLQGLDPAQSIALAIDACTRARAINPGDDMVDENSSRSLAEAYLKEAERRVHIRESPAQPTAHARACLEDAMRGNPNHWRTYCVLCRLELLEAKSGSPAAAAFDRARLALERALGLNSASAELYSLGAELYRRRAAWKRSVGQSADEDLRLADQLSDSARAIRPGLAHP